MRPLARLVALPAVAVVLACAPAVTVRGPRLPRGKSQDTVTFWTVEAALSNGARAVSYEFRQTRLADVAVSFDGGTADDPPGKEGLALLATIAAQKATGRGGISVAERAFALGAISDEDATEDAIQFTLRVPPDRLAAALAIERDRLADPATGLADEDVTELRERLASVLERWETAPAFQLQRLVATALPGTRYARTAPSPASLRAITAEDVRAFLRAHVRPDRMIVSVSGPAAAAEALDTVAEAFGATVSKPERLVPPAPEPVAVAPRDAAALVVRMPSTAARLWLAWRTDGLGHGARTAFLAAVAEVGAAKAAARMNEVKHLSAHPVLFRTAGLVVLEVELTDAKDAEQVRKKLVKQIASTAKGLSGLLMGRHGRFDAFQLEKGGVSGVAPWLRATGEHDVFGGNRRAFDEDFGRFELARVARETLARDRAFAIVVEPDRAADAEPPQPEAVEGGKDPWTLVPNLLAAAAPGASEVPKLVRPPGLDAATRRRLSNGLEVVVLPRGAFPIVTASLVFPEEDVPTLRARARARVTLLSARARRGCGPAHFSEGGAQVELWGEAYSEQLPYLLDRVACWTRMQPEDWPFRAARDQIARERETSFWRGMLATEQTLFPGAAATSDPGALVRGIGYEEGRAWFAGAFRPERATLVLTGNLLPTEALWNELEASFGGWRPAAAPVERGAPVPPPPAARTLTLVHVPGAKRARVAVRVRAPSIPERDALAFETLRAHLRDRLERSVLPRLGTVEVGTAEGLATSELFFDVSVDAALAAGAVRTTLEELDRAVGGATAPAIDFARWDTARRLALSHATVRALNGDLAQLAIHGLPPDTYEHAGPELAGVSPDRVQEAARALAVGREAIVVWGDAGKLEAPLRALGFGLKVIHGPVTTTKK